MPEPMTTDCFAAVTTRWSWQSDENYAASVERRRADNVEKIATLRLLADIVEAADVPAPYICEGYDPTFWEARWVAKTVDGAAAIRRALGTPVGERWDKKTDGGRLSVVLTGQRLHLEVAVTGTTCEAVEVGTEEVEKSVYVCPDCDADLTSDDGRTVCGGCGWVEAVAKRTVRTVTVPAVEWVCPELNGAEVTA